MRFQLLWDYGVVGVIGAAPLAREKYWLSFLGVVHMIRGTCDMEVDRSTPVWLWYSLSGDCVPQTFFRLMIPVNSRRT